MHNVAIDLKNKCKKVDGSYLLCITQILWMKTGKIYLEVYYDLLMIILRILYFI